MWYKIRDFLLGSLATFIVLVWMIIAGIILLIVAIPILVGTSIALDYHRVSEMGKYFEIQLNLLWKGLNV